MGIAAVVQGVVTRLVLFKGLRMNTEAERASDELVNEEDVERDSAVEMRTLFVDAPLHAQRIDKALLALAPEFSRNYLQQLLKDAAVQINGVQVLKASTKVQAGQTITLELRPTPQSQAYQPQAMPLDIVYEDDAMLVLNKPVGLVVHPAAGNWSGTLLNGLLAYDPVFATLPRAGIVHRLDKDTSGLMVVAKTAQAITAISAAIAAREVKRQYLALGYQNARMASSPWAYEDEVHVDAPIGRDPYTRTRMAVVDLLRHSGKSAQTDIRLLAQEGQFVFVQCRLQTGRTHQIRVHMQHLGFPLVGDALYGGKSWPNFNRQALHAYRLSLAHPSSGKIMTFKAFLPQDMQELLLETGMRDAIEEQVDDGLVNLLGNR